LYEEWGFSLTPQFIAVQGGRATTATVLTVSLQHDGKRLKPLKASGPIDFTAMNRGVNESASRQA